MPNFLVSYLTDASSYAKTLQDQRRLGQGAVDINRKTQASLVGLNDQQRRVIGNTREMVAVTDVWGNRVYVHANEGRRAMRRLGDTGVREARRMENGFNRVNRSLGGLRTIIGTIVGGFGIGLAGRQIVRTIYEMSDALGYLQFNAGLADNAMAGVERQLRDIAEISRFTATEVTGAAIQFVKGGFDIQTAISAMTSTLQFATVGQVDLNESIAFATQLLKAYQLQTADLTRIWDVLLTTQQNSLAQVNRLSGSFEKVAATTASLGISVEETAAAFGILADAGIEGENAGTQLRIVMGRLVRPTGDAADALARYGLAVEDVSLESNRWEDVLRRLADANIALGDQQQIFNERAFNTSNILLTNIERYEQLVEANRNSNGTLAEGVRIMSRTLPAAAKRSAAAFEELALSMGKVLTPLLISGLDRLSETLLYLSDNLGVLGGTGFLFGGPVLFGAISGLIGGILASGAWRTGFVNPIKALGKTMGRLITSIAAIPVSIAGALLGGLFGGALLPFGVGIRQRMRVQRKRHGRYDDEFVDLYESHADNTEPFSRFGTSDDGRARAAIATPMERFRAESRMRELHRRNSWWEDRGRARTQKWLDRSTKLLAAAMLIILKPLRWLENSIKALASQGWKFIIAGLKALALFAVKFIKYSPVMLGALYLFRDVMRDSLIPGVSYLGRTLEAVGRVVKEILIPGLERWLRDTFDIDFKGIASGLAGVVADLIFGLAKLTDYIITAGATIYEYARSLWNPDLITLTNNKAYNKQWLQTNVAPIEQMLLDENTKAQELSRLQNERSMARLQRNMMLDLGPPKREAVEGQRPDEMHYLDTVDIWNQDLQSLDTQIGRLDNQIGGLKANMMPELDRRKLATRVRNLQAQGRRLRLPETVWEGAAFNARAVWNNRGTPLYDALVDKYYEVTQEDHLRDRLGRGLSVNIPRDTDNKAVFGATSGTDTPGVDTEATVWRDFNRETREGYINLFNSEKVAEKKLRIIQLEVDLIEEGTAYTQEQLRNAEKQIERQQRIVKLYEDINAELRLITGTLEDTFRQWLDDGKTSWSQLGEDLADAFVDSWVDKVVEGIDNATDFIQAAIMRVFDNEQENEGNFWSGLTKSFLGIHGEASGESNTNLPNSSAGSSGGGFNFGNPFPNTPPPGTASAPGIQLNYNPTVNNNSGTPAELQQILKLERQQVIRDVQAVQAQQQRTGRR